MVKSKLPNTALAKIWRLADHDGDGMLTDEEFALAMHLIDLRAGGHGLPDTLPEHLIPPTQRGKCEKVKKVGKKSVRQGSTEEKSLMQEVEKVVRQRSVKQESPEEKVPDQKIPLDRSKSFQQQRDQSSVKKRVGKMFKRKSTKTQIKFED